MLVMEYDKEKHAAAVQHASDLEKQRVDLATSMHDRKAKKKNEKWTDAEFMQYRNDVSDYQILVSDVQMAEQVVMQYEKLKPRPKQTESAMLRDPMARWGLMVMGQTRDNLFSEDERAQYLMSGEEAARITQINPNSVSEVFRYRMPDRVSDGEMRTRSDASSGEVINPEVTLPRIVHRLNAFGGAARFCQMFTTPRGNDLVLPHLDDTGNEGEQRANQDAAVTDRDLNDVGGTTFKSYTYSSKVISVSYEAEQDSVPLLMDVVQDIAGRRIGRIRNKRLTKGTGVNQPRGLVTCAKEAFTTAGSNAVTLKEITKLMYAVDDAYISGEGDPLGFPAEAGAGVIGFMGHRAIEQFLVELTDGDDRPLWLPSIRERLGGEIYGQPFIKNYDMDPLTMDGGFSLIYGNGNYYAHRMVQDVMFMRFFDSGTVTGAGGKLSVKFLAIARGDGQPRGGFSAANVTEAFQKMKTKA